MANKLSISTKKTGDKLTATEFNAVVDAINENGASIDALNTSNGNMSETVSAVQQTQNAQANDIKKIKDTQTEQGDSISSMQKDITQLGNDAVKMVVISQDDYDVLIAAGTVDADTYYNILEE